MAFLQRINNLCLPIKRPLQEFCRGNHVSTESRTINKILIANRGEIAVRVMKTAKKMGIQTVAVYSDADRESLFVKMADEAYNIGPAASLESYLRKDKVIEAAKKSGAQAIHPGYGFLSENMEFAELCPREGIIFIGPSSAAIRDMGIKSTSKYIMSSAGVPIIEGYHGEDQSDDRLLEEAEKIKFPVMIKAVRGGGGKGMRIASRREEFLSQLESARNEARKAYNDTVVLLEKYVNTPRHVEVQVFGDSHGNYIYLYERDCSVQRRHQKIIEEAPAPHISEETRRQLGEAAVRAARAVKYVGAGTVEFIMDKEENFYFMEMNTRLQVEHPVTEMVTGTDLVMWQIMVAAGEPLPVKQEDLELRGHAFEARIYAEDPANNFMPGAGPLTYLSTPEVTEAVRVETGVRQGDEVTVHYDPMIAKLVVWSHDRQSALIKLQSALREYNIVGLNTNVQFLDDLAGNKYFQEGRVHTGFIPEHRDDLFPCREMSDHDAVSSALALMLLEQKNVKSYDPPSSRDFYSPFSKNHGVRLNHHGTKIVKLKDGIQDLQVTLTSDGRSEFKATFNGQSHEARAWLDESQPNKTILVCCIDGVMSRSNVVLNEDVLHVFNARGSYQMKSPYPKFVSNISGESGGTQGKGGARSPMPGVVDKIFVKPGGKVKSGDPVAVIIAMKMEYVIRSSTDGVVKRLVRQVGETVGKNAEIIVIEENES